MSAAECGYCIRPDSPATHKCTCDPLCKLVTCDAHKALATNPVKLPATNEAQGEKR